MPNQLPSGRYLYPEMECGVSGGVIFDPETNTFFAPKYNATYCEGSWKRSNALFGTFATSGEAQDAKLTVSQLKTYFAKLPMVGQNKYKIQYDTIVKAWDDYDSSWIFYTFDQAVTIGKKAQELLFQLSREYPVVVPVDSLSKSPVGGTTLADVAPDIGRLALLAAVVGGAFILSKK